MINKIIFFSLEPYKEELFEVVACYFPMEYKPVRVDNEFSMIKFLFFNRKSQILKLKKL
jgi:hypothetical protein